MGIGLGIPARAGVALLVALLSDGATLTAAPRGPTREPPAGHVALAHAPLQTTELTLPFDGVWGVLQGMDSDATDATHFGYAAFALDFVPAERLTPGRPVVRRRVGDFPCYGRDILAAAPGVVVWAEDGARDGPVDPRASVGPGPGAATGEASAPTRVPAQHDAGNFVIVAHTAGELTEYRHLQRGSVRVAVGARVRRGQVLGRCGNSGNAGTPHLHLGFLGSVDPIATRPMRLSGYEVLGPDGAWTPGDGSPRAGVILRATRARAGAR
jgi:Peptidase family M23